MTIRWFLAGKGISLKKSGGSKTDTNAWMTTYTDLTTLLLTFFVLLLSLATIDERKKRVALNSLVGAFGFKPGAHSIIGELDGMNITLGSAPMKKEEISYEKLQNVVIKNTLEKEVEVLKEADRIVLTMGNQVLFEDGSSRLEEKGRLFLAQLVPIIKTDDPKIVEMRGFAARSELFLKEDSTREAVLLSTQRAMTVFRYFALENGVPAAKLVAHGFGESPYLNQGNRRKGALNRQVQIIFDFEEKIPYRLRKPTGDSVLDFNGFLFRFPGNLDEPRQ